MLLQCIGVFNLMVEKCEKEPMVYYICKLCVDGRYINRLKYKNLEDIFHVF